MTITTEVGALATVIRKLSVSNPSNFFIETKRNYDYTPYIAMVPVGSIEFEKGGMRFICNISAKQYGRSLII